MYLSVLLKFLIMGWLLKQAQTGAVVDPIARQRVQEHLAIHYQYLQKTNPVKAREIGQKIAAELQRMGPVGPIANSPVPIANAQPETVGAI
jgi:hypothetical protein